MKQIKSSIGLLLTTTLIVSFFVPLVRAQDGSTEPERACAEKLPDYQALKEAWDDVGNKNSEAYQEAFENAQEAYHDYVGCLFNFAESEILQSEGAEHGGTIQANTLNTGTLPIVGGLIDWMAPDQACISREELNRVILKSEPTQMLGPILQAHADYKKHLLYIRAGTTSEGIETTPTGNSVGGADQLELKITATDQLSRQTQMEIDSSLMAIDLMFTSLKELRLAFVMHVHFQCALKFLDQYRLALEQLRKIVVPLPNQLRDASFVK